MKTCDDAVVCVLGDFCVLKTGDIGVCQPLTQCTTAVYQALNGDMPIVCSIKENMPIVCCMRSPTVRLQPETHQNIIQKQTPPQFTSQYYLFDAGTHEIPTADFPVRHSREDGNKPWWLIEKPFTVTTSAPLQKPQSSNNNNGNTNHHQGISRPGNLQNQRWYSERPLSSALPPPPPPSPPPNKPTPKPITESVNSQNRRNGHATVSEISKLNPNIQKLFKVCFCSHIGVDEVRYIFFWDITLDHWVFGCKGFKPNQWSHLQWSKCPERIHLS